MVVFMGISALPVDESNDVWTSVILLPLKVLYIHVTGKCKDYQHFTVI